MLSIASIKSASGAAAYFAEDNYYTIEEGTEQSVWYGEGASELGFDGKVTKDSFERVLNGLTPSGEQVGIAGKRRLGLDLTFSASKSASVLALVGKDQRLIDAFGQSVKDTLKFVEQNLVQARTEQNGKFVPTDTKKLVAALFTHDTSRAQEPGLHIHAIIANMTQDKDGRWRALHNDKIWEYQSLIGNVQASFFRDAVEKLGYQTERTGKHGQFEIVGVPQNVKDAFSSRRAEILAKAGELGIVSPEGRDAIRITTREAKPKDVDRVGLAASWLATSKGLGFDPVSLFEKSVAALAAPTKLDSVLQTFHDLKAKFDNLFKPRDPLVDTGVGFTAKSPVAVKDQFVTASAIRMLSEREAGFERLDVVRAALSFDERGVAPQAVLNRIDRLVDGGLVVAGIGRAATQITTPDAISRERNILRQVDLGRGGVTPTLPSGIAYASLERLTSTRPLNAGQLEAGVKILSSSDRIVQVQGIAGAGKSTLFAAIGQALEDAGVGVEGTAFANKMVNDLKIGSAIDSRTVHGFLNDNQRFIDGERGDAFDARRAELSGSFLLLDEASLVSNRQMEGLAIAANIFGLEKLAIVGDKAQLSAIEAGKPQALLEAYGIDIAYMTQNLRQRTPKMIEVAGLANSGQAKAAIKALGNSVIESPDRASAASALWLAMSPSERERTAIFTSGKVVRDEINAAVQNALRAEGTIGSKRLNVEVVESQDATREEFRYAKTYKPGMALDVAFGNRELGLSRGTYQIRRGNTDGKVVLVGRGKSINFDPKTLSPGRDYGLSITAAKNIELSAGDKIRWTAKDKARGITNASLGTVLSIDDGVVRIATESVISERLKFNDPKLADDDHKKAIAAYLAADKKDSDADAALKIKSIANGKVETERTQTNVIDLHKDDPMLKRIALAYALNIHMAQGVTTDQSIQVMGAGEKYLSTLRQLVVGLTRARDNVWLVTDDAKKLGERIERNLGNKTSALEIIGEATVEPERARVGAAPANWSPDDPGGLERPATGASKDQTDPHNLAGLYEALGIAQPEGARTPAETKTASVTEPAPPRTQDAPEKIKELDR